MKKLVVFVVLLSCFSFLSGCNGKAMEQSQSRMYIKPSAFSEETIQKDFDGSKIKYSDEYYEILGIER